MKQRRERRIKDHADRGTREQAERGPTKDHGGRGSGGTGGPVAAFRLVVEYDGTRFRGWQKQGEVQKARTVVGELSRAIAESGFRVETLMGSGRTDTGVHALGQVAHVHLRPPGPASPDDLRKALDKRLPPDVAIRSLKGCAPSFHARHDALDRTYLYQLSRRPTAIGHAFAWHVDRPIDLARLTAAWRAFEGFHDVSAFALIEPGANPQCEMGRCEAAEAGALVLLRVTASHFNRRQVRRMVGAAVRCGTGLDDPARVLRDLRNPTDQAALYWGTQAAPPHGLFLERVRYPGDPALPAIAPVLRL